MISLPFVSVIEFIVGVIIWWIGIFLISQNLYRKTLWLIFGLFFSISFYFSTYIFFYSAISTENYPLIGPILKSIEWSIYLPMALFYHISFGSSINKKQRRMIILSYLVAFICIALEMFTELTRNYDFIASTFFKGDLATATGPFFWLSAAYINVVLILSMLNLKTLIDKTEKRTIARKRLLLVFWALVIAILMSPFVVLGYYNVIPYASELSSVCYLLITVPLFYSIVKYNLFIDDTKVVFSKGFIYSTIYIFLVLISFYVVIYISGAKLHSPQSFILPFLLTYLVIASHPFYGWISTFSNDIIYNIKSGLSVVNDQEVYSALRAFSNPEKLEENTLLRLRLVNNKNRSKSEIDALRQIIKESIDYFKPEIEQHRRIKSNLKYYLLKMLVFDQAEEGQILWELGFEEYPVKILSNERKYRAPLFKIESPADYTYTSRNAFLALKKEAIHDVTWRISYLEKRFKGE